MKCFAVATPKREITVHIVIMDIASVDDPRIRSLTSACVIKRRVFSAFGIEIIKDTHIYERIGIRRRRRVGDDLNFPATFFLKHLGDARVYIGRRSRKAVC